MSNLSEYKDRDGVRRTLPTVDNEHDLIGWTHLPYTRTGHIAGGMPEMTAEQHAHVDEWIAARCAYMRAHPMQPEVSRCDAGAFHEGSYY